MKIIVIIILILIIIFGYIVVSEGKQRREYEKNRRLLTVENYLLIRDSPYAAQLSKYEIRCEENQLRFSTKDVYTLFLLKLDKSEPNGVKLMGLDGYGIRDREFLKYIGNLIQKIIEKNIKISEQIENKTQNGILDTISIKKSVNPNMDEYIEIADILSVKEFEKIKNFILKNGDKRFYRNYDNDNPHYHFDDFHTYLNAEIGQRNMYNDPEISDFNEITIHDWNEHDLQYYTIKIIRKGDIENELIYVEEEMKEGSVYLLNRYEKDIDLMLQNLKGHYLVKLRDKINSDP